MRVVLDVTSVPDPKSLIQALEACLENDHDRLITTCRATETERVLALQTWLSNKSNGRSAQSALPTSGSKESSTALEGLFVWQPSGLNTPEVDANLFAAFVTALMPDIIISDLPKQVSQGDLPVITLTDINKQIRNSDTLRAQLLAHIRTTEKNPPDKKGSLLRLAFLSPLHPARSGVADYSDELLKGLREYYEVTLIDTTPEDLRDWDDSKLEFADTKNIDWFLTNWKSFDRVLYQLGDSDYHAGIAPAMAKVPGVATLHDLYQGHYLASEQRRGHPNLWPEILLYEVGYHALSQTQKNYQATAFQYPCNYRVFRDSLGVVLHSQYAAKMATEQVGPEIASRVQVIPHARLHAGTPTPPEKTLARRTLGLPSEGIIVCSFGYIDAAKSPLRLLEAWRNSDLAKDPAARLIFVGRNHPGDFGQQVADAIARLPKPEHVHITGFVPAQTFAQYLTAADFAVQLRGVSRGETSGAALHAMAYGLPQIVNANGSFAELDAEAVCMLPDDFTSDEILQAIETLSRDRDKRLAMSVRGPAVIEDRHSPAACAQAYYNFIESSYQQRFLSHPQALLAAIRQAWPDGEISPEQRASLANAIDFNRTVSLPRPRLLLDISSTHQSELQTGIERVALALLDALIELEPEGLVVTPVYLDNSSGRWHYRQANALMSKRLKLSERWLTDHLVMPRRADVLLTLDLATGKLTQANEQGVFHHFRACGVRCYSIVYDLLPVTMPEAFPPHTKQSHESWLSVISQFEGALCISKHVASELRRWHRAHSERTDSFRIDSFMLGADTETFQLSDASSTIEPSNVATNAPNLGHEMTRPPVFLMVGTIEPRKGYLETLQTFTALWDYGFKGHLIIVGREGWTHLEESDRKDIPETVELLTSHPERFRRLLWMCDADDVTLKRAYARADCLIAASYDEGFGLPIVEATRSGVPVLARDIPVFREVAPSGTTFFKHGELAEAIRQWTKPEHPPKDEHTITWQESAQQVLQWLRAG